MEFPKYQNASKILKFKINLGRKRGQKLNLHYTKKVFVCSNHAQSSYNNASSETQGQIVGAREICPWVSEDDNNGDLTDDFRLNQCPHRFLSLILLDSFQLVNDLTVFVK